MLKKTRMALLELQLASNILFGGSSLNGLK